MANVKRQAFVPLLFILLAGICKAEDQVPWVANLEQAKVEAAQQNKLVLLHFWSLSCGPCRSLDRYVFNHPELGRSFGRNVVPVKVNVMSQPDLARQYGVTRIPTDVFLTPAGEEITRTISPKTVDAYVELVHRVVADSPSIMRSAGHAIVQAAQIERETAARQYDAQVSSYQQPAGGSATSAAGSRDGQLYQLAQHTQSGQFQSNSSPYQQPYGAAPAATSTNQSAYGAAQPQNGAYGQPIQNDPRRYSAAPNGNVQNSNAWGGSFNAPQSTATPTQNNYAPQGRVFAAPGSNGAATPNVAPNGHLPANSGQFPAQGQSTPGLSHQPQQNAAPWQSNPYGAKPQQSGGTAPSDSQRPAPNWANSPARHPSNQRVPNQHLTPPSQPGNLAIAMDGYCPVSLLEAQDPSKAWVKGDPRFGAVHRGRTYLFAGMEQQQKFMMNPDVFSPALSCHDAVRFAERNELVEGRRQHGVSYRGQIFLFADEASLQAFWKDPLRYTNVVHQAMQQNALGRSQR